MRTGLQNSPCMCFPTHWHALAASSTSAWRHKNELHFRLRPALHLEQVSEQQAFGWEKWHNQVAGAPVHAASLLHPSLASLDVPPSMSFPPPAALLQTSNSIPNSCISHWQAFVSCASGCCIFPYENSSLLSPLFPSHPEPYASMVPMLPSAAQYCCQNGICYTTASVPCVPGQLLGGSCAEIWAGEPLQSPPESYPVLAPCLPRDSSSWRTNRNPLLFTLYH